MAYYELKRKRGKEREREAGGFNEKRMKVFLLSYFVSIYSVQLVKRSILCTKVQRSAIRAQCRSTIYFCFDIEFPIVKKKRERRGE